MSEATNTCLEASAVTTATALVIVAMLALRLQAAFVLQALLGIILNFTSAVPPGR